MEYGQYATDVTVIWITGSTVPSTTMPNITGNDTTANPPNDGGVNLTLASQILATSALVLMMLSMGVTIDFKHLKETFRHPAGFFIGMASQFILMPLIGFCLSLALKLEVAGALSVLILACCPGGTLSNVFTYWTNGDVCLSVSMTTVSTAAAIGMMPLNLFIYSRVWTSESAVVPYLDIFTTLITILIPVSFGMFLHWWKEAWTTWISRISLTLAVIATIGSVAVSILLNPSFHKAGWGLWLCSIVLPALGFAIGYGFALLFRQPHAKCRAIAFETGSQNVGLAWTLTLLSFVDSPLFLDMLFYPILYTFFIHLEPLVLVGLYRCVVYMRRGKEEDTGDNVEIVRVESKGLEANGSEIKGDISYSAYSQEVDTEVGNTPNKSVEK
ncbi:ileal sodium/bile acid cotransporter-like [Diadema antillarum]|uniref:ileal sodium/bile acid cotransporter-like n=1 Tax=Diadema antillarum TaxID=105358 RepID=UPI003A85A819